MKHLLLPYLLFVCISLTAFGRTHDPPPYTVKGKVVSFLDKHPLPGVNVVIEGSSRGVITDVDGSFTIEIEENDTLIFSYVGYETLHFPVNGQTELYIELTEGIETLQEIAIFSTGYEEISPEKATGSFSHIDNKLLERNVGPDLNSRLNGVAPSLLMDQRSGEGAYFNIRGASTILANDQPLIVVDNFPFNGNLNSLNPNDIESITILRDAAAASIWGVRAGNGVIVVTTKKGSVGSPLRVSINANVTTGEHPDLYYENRMSTSDFIDVEKMLFDNGYFDALIDDSRMPGVSPVVEILLKERNGEITNTEATAQMDALREYDVRKELKEHFYRTSINQQYAVNLSGGSEKHGWYASTGYDNNLSGRVGNRYERLSLNTRHTFNPLENLEIDALLTYTQSRSESDNTLSYIRMGSRNIYPYVRFTDDEGNALPIVTDYREGFAEGAEKQSFLDWEFNPLQELGLSENSGKSINVRAAAGIRYTLLPGLSADVKYQYEGQTSRTRIFNPVESYFARDMINRFSIFDGTSVTGYNIPVGGILTFSNNDLYSHNGRAQLNYSLTRQHHALTALAGFEVREISTEGYSNRFYGYDEELGSSSPVNYQDSYLTYPDNTYATIPGFQGVSGTIDRFRSWFVNAAYTYGDRYTVSLSGRLDQSNLFGVKANHRNAPLWSAGGKWQIDREGFFKSQFFSSLALRATYGFNGNLDQSVTAYTTARFVTASYSRRQAAMLVTPPNPELRWEKSGMLNIGVDFAIGDNALSGSVEYYRKKGVDLIGQGPMDPTKGFDTFKGNIAGMKGRGWDIELNAMPFSGAFTWQSNLLFSYATDEVTKYYLEPGSITDYFIDGSVGRSSTQYTPVVGKPLFAVYSFPWAGLDPDTGDPRGYVEGEASNDYSAIHNNATVDSLVYHGRALPPFFGAWRNSFSYKGWSLSFNITYRFGYYFRRSSISYSGLYGYYEAHGDFENRWQQPGDEKYTNVPSMVYPADASRDAFYTRSEVLVEKGDNIRLQDIRISYDFARPGKSFGQMEFYGYVNNVGILWKANKAGIDPDFPQLPLPRTYALGMKLSF